MRCQDILMPRTFRAATCWDDCARWSRRGPLLAAAPPRSSRQSMLAANHPCTCQVFALRPWSEDEWRPHRTTSCSNVSMSRTDRTLWFRASANGPCDQPTPSPNRPVARQPRESNDRPGRCGGRTRRRESPTIAFDRGLVVGARGPRGSIVERRARCREPTTSVASRGCRVVDRSP